MSERDQLLAQLMEIKKQCAHEDEVLYPDCNGTLRISAGHVEVLHATLWRSERENCRATKQLMP